MNTLLKIALGLAGTAVTAKVIAEVAEENRKEKERHERIRAGVEKLLNEELEVEIPRIAKEATEKAFAGLRAESAKTQKAIDEMLAQHANWVAQNRAS